MARKKNNEDNFDDILSQALEFEPREPVALSKARIRSTKRLMREIMLDILHSEDDNGDSRAELILDSLCKKAENGSIQATELILKMIKEMDDKAKVDVNIPEIKIIVDNDANGIRYSEK